MNEESNQHSALTETTYAILLSLSDGPRHGYAIMQDVSALSEGRIALGTGTLYGGLRRLLAQGWIERVDDDQGGGRERKAYTLTALGQQVVTAETARLRQLLDAASRRLSPGQI